MEAVLNRQETIQEIVKNVKHLDDLELQILLTKLRVKKLQKNGVKPVAKNSRNIKFPTMEEINLWKHEARKKDANK